MKSPVFRSTGFYLGSGALPSVELSAGGVALWPVQNDHHAREALDAVLGLIQLPPGAAVWFDRDLAGTTIEQLRMILWRVAPLGADGGLIGNINVCENILLPCMERGVEKRGDPLGELEALLAEPPWSGWLAVDQLTSLPHTLTDPCRIAAGLLRAYLCRPEAIVAADLFGRLDGRERPAMEEAVAWVRRQLPGCAWLFLLPERALPPGCDETNLPAKA